MYTKLHIYLGKSEYHNRSFIIIIIIIIIIILVIIIIIIIVIIIIIKLYYTMQQLLQNANHYQGNFDKVLYDRDIFHQFSSVLHGIC